MDLKKFDGQCVQIIDDDGNVFEGFCEYCDQEFNECEFGLNEDSMEILNYKFLKSTIKNIFPVDLEDNSFLEGYGLLEQENSSSYDVLEDTLLCEHIEHVCRMLNYLIADPLKIKNLTTNDCQKLFKLLKDFILKNEDQNITDRCNRLLDFFEKK